MTEGSRKGEWRNERWNRRNVAERYGWEGGGGGVVVLWCGVVFGCRLRCVPFSKGGGGGAEVPNELNQGSV